MSTKQRVALLTILLLAFGLRMARVGELRMWGDEAYSVYSAHRTLTAITFEGAENDPHPPLYYYLLHFYMPLAGASELALRFFSVFPGVATVALAFVTGKRLFGARTGLVAALFAAAAPFDVYYSQEIRMYALAIFLTTLALYFFVRWHMEISNVRWIFPYAIVMLMAMYSLYHTAFVFVAEGIFVLFYWRTRRAFVLRWFAVSGAVVLVFLPWLALRFSSTLGHLEDRAGRTIQSLPVFVARGFAALTAGATIPPANAMALAAIFGVLIVLGLLIAMRSRRVTAGDGLVLALAIVPLVAVYPLYITLPILVARLFALAFVPLALLVGRSLVVVEETERRAAVPFALALVAICVYSLNDYYFRFDRYNAAAEDYVPVVHAVEQQAHAGDMVLFHAYWQMGYFLSHYAGPPVEYRLLDNEADLNAAAAAPRNVWAVLQGLDLTGAEVWLARNAFPVSNVKYGEMRLALFRAGIPERGNHYDPPVVFSNGIALLGYRINREPVESGSGLVMVQLDWQAPAQKLADDYTVSVRLTDAKGETIWAQEDNQPADGTRATSTWEPNQVIQDRHAFRVPPGTPPGEYAARVVLYQSSTGSPVNIVAPDNVRGQSLSLGMLAVSRPEKVAAVQVPKGLDAQWNEIALAGFESSAAEAMPGDTLLLTFYWQARQKPTRDYRASILVLDSTGGWRAANGGRPAGDALPTTAWSSGETWIQRMPVTLDAGSSSGEATVYVLVQDDGSDETIPVRTDAAPHDLEIKGRFGGNALVHAVPLTKIDVKGREQHFDLPAPQFPSQVNWDNKIKLLGYDVRETDFKAGSACTLTLYWQALDRISQRYTVFVHLLNASGDLVAQTDAEPEGGAAPTTSWLPREIITDPYRIELPPGLAPGEYTLEVGLYQAAGGKRLAIAGSGDDHFQIPNPKIKIQK